MRRKKTNATFNPKKTNNKKEASTGEYRGIMFESYEELSFLYWAFELKDKGYITSISRSPSFLLSDALMNNYAVNLKTKSKPMAQKLLHGHSYTPEFILEWDHKKSRDRVIHILGVPIKVDKPIICQVIDGKYVSFIEVKPTWDQNNMERLFMLNMKWMWQKHSIYVNLIKPQELFPHTFTPELYLTTRTGRKRELKWKPKSLFNYLKS